MKLVLLGTGGYFPTRERHTACTMLPEVGVLLDAGTGMCYLSNFLRTGRLDIFLSHAHLDHVAGLTYLINLLPAYVLRQTTVHGDPDKLIAVENHLFDEEIFPIAPTFKFVPLTSPVSLAGGGKLSYFPLVHPGGSLGYRLEWPGHTMAYVTDTTASANAAYVEQIRGVDLLVHEANFPTDAGNLPAITGHSALMKVAEAAAAAKVGRLVLVHIDPQVDAASAFDLNAARKVFRNIELGADRMELEF